MDIMTDLESITRIPLMSNQTSREREQGQEDHVGPVFILYCAKYRFILSNSYFYLFYLIAFIHNAIQKYRF